MEGKKIRLEVSSLPRDPGESETAYRDRLTEHWTKRARERCTVTCILCQRPVPTVDSGCRCPECRTSYQDQTRRYRQALGGSAMSEFFNASFQTYQTILPGQVNVSEAAKMFAKGERGRVLLIVGNTGTGKTHLTCAILRERLGRGSASYRLAMDMVRAVGHKWGRTAKWARAEADYLDQIRGIDLLAIDNLDQTPTEPAVLRFWSEIVDARYAAQRDTILVANQSYDEVRDLFTPEAVDRLRGMMGGHRPLVFGWQSYRVGGGTP